MLFPEGLASEDEFSKYAIEIRKKHPKSLLLANMTEFGKTPYIPFNTFTQYGYNCVIYPVSTLRVAAKAAEDLVDDLLKYGSLEKSLPRYIR